MHKETRHETRTPHEAPHIAKPPGPVQRKGAKTEAEK